MRLNQFIEQNVEAIVTEWETFARGCCARTRERIGHTALLPATATQGTVTLLEPGSIAPER
jgi:hypothetical protein